MICVFVSAGDQAGVGLLKELPPVKKTGSLQWPDIADNSLQTSLFAGTDFLTWLLIGYGAQLRFGGWYQREREPFKGLSAKASTHLAQVIADTLVLPVWKNGQEGLNPNNLCLPGIVRDRVQRYHGDMSLLRPFDHRDFVNVMRLNDTHVVYPHFSNRVDTPPLDRPLLERPPEYHLFVLLFDFLELGCHGALSACRGDFRESLAQWRPRQEQGYELPGGYPQQIVPGQNNGDGGPSLQGSVVANLSANVGNEYHDPDANEENVPADENVLPVDDFLPFALTEIESKVQEYARSPLGSGGMGRSGPHGQG